MKHYITSDQVSMKIVNDRSLGVTEGEYNYIGLLTKSLPTIDVGFDWYATRLNMTTLRCEEVAVKGGLTDAVHALLGLHNSDQSV